MSQADKIAAHELLLFGNNDAILYRQQEVPIQQNLTRKWKKGTYNHTKVITLWGYWADSAAERYTKEHGTGGGFGIFTKATRMMTAKEKADEWLEEMEITFPKRNPGARWHEIRRKEADQYDRAAKSDRLKEFFHGKSVAHLESSLAARAMGMNPGLYKVKIIPNYEEGGYDVEIWEKRTNQPIAWSNARTKKEAYKEAERLLAGRRNPGRPHGTFRSCVRKVARQRPRVRDPKAVCGVALSRAYPKSQTRNRSRLNPIAVYGLGNPRSNGRINAKIEGVIYNRIMEIKAEKTGYKRGFYRHPFDAKSKVQILALDNGDLLVHSTAGVKLWKRD
jgi:hypothetical protein